MTLRSKQALNEMALSFFGGAPAPPRTLLLMPILSMSSALLMLSSLSLLPVPPLYNSKALPAEAGPDKQGTPADVKKHL
jgi:hypothetical protein